MKNKLSGWKDVFSFTLAQTLKSKAFIVSFVIMMLLAMAASPVMSIISSNEGENGNYTITKIYVYDETGYFNADTVVPLLKDGGWKVEIAPGAEPSGSAYDELCSRVDKTETNSVLLSITAKEGPVELFLEYSRNGEVKRAELTAFEEVLCAALKECRYNAVGVDAAQRELLSAQVLTNVVHADMEGNVVEKEDTSISDFEYGFLYALLFIGMMICMMTGSQVASSIVVEKSSKVVEFLLTTIKPLAIIVGKVLAMLCVVMTEMVGLIVVFAASNAITGQKTGENMLAKMVSPEVLGMLNPLNIVIGLVFIALGMVFYATLAGLAGATVSRMEEIGEGLVMFSISVLVGLYIGIGAASSLLGAGDNPFAIFAMLFPLSSPFLMPGAIIIGKAPIWVTVVSLLLLIGLVAILFWFVARVYEALIVHNGNRVGLKQLFKMRS
ncbi:MAG: ABC transporter permease [Lachnospiraceae bacterium]|nr:ABC transporter permease [Lachnospiraceae bacterium]